jgi:Methyltransferase domain
MDSRAVRGLWPKPFDPAAIGPTVDFLAQLAVAGPALELGIGIGRIALPLSRRGVRVHGIELSPAMVAQLRRREGTAAIDVTIGDSRLLDLAGHSSWSNLLSNTITNLTTHPRRADLDAPHVWETSQPMITASGATFPPASLR